MRKHLKHFFIPHHANNYHPHILHSKRALLYSLVFLSMKAILLTFIVFLPEEAFLAPDVLNEHYLGIVNQTNKLRKEHGVQPLTILYKLDRSAQMKTEDMADHQYFSHVGTDDRTLADFLHDVKYDYLAAGENLAMGFNDAESVVDAWKKSPTHYANLIDPEFKEIGVGLQAGYYHGAATVYMTQHFGEPRPPMVQGTKISDEPIIMKSENSKAYWLETPEGTMVQIHTEVYGPVGVVTAQIGSYTMQLKNSGENQYVGTTIVQERSDYLFSPVILPSIAIIDTVGKVHRFHVDWYAPKISPPDTLQKYSFGKDSLGSVTPLFDVANSIFAGSIVLFFIALLLYLFLNIRRHNYKVIGQTMAVLALLVTLRLI